MATFRLVVREGDRFFEDTDYETETLPRVGDHILSALRDGDMLVKIVAVVHYTDSSAHLILVVGELVSSGKKLDMLEIAAKAVRTT